MYTGAWTLQISRRAPPNTKFIALDVNTSQLPPKVFLADNMEVKHCNLLEPPATDLLEAFDITHILLVLLFVTDDLIQLVQNIIKMLKTVRRPLAITLAAGA
jgi:ubiquinone/menaquinone biosynthesis C-methylase UbiE